MPVSVRKGSGDKPWKIVEVKTGRTVGSSKTKDQAESSVRVRNAIHFDLWKPKRSKRLIKKRK